MRAVFALSLCVFPCRGLLTRVSEEWAGDCKSALVYQKKVCKTRALRWTPLGCRICEKSSLLLIREDSTCGMVVQRRPSCIAKCCDRRHWDWKTVSRLIKHHTWDRVPIELDTSTHEELRESTESTKTMECTARLLQNCIFGSRKLAAQKRLHGQCMVEIGASRNSAVSGFALHSLFGSEFGALRDKKVIKKIGFRGC